MADFLDSLNEPQKEAVLNTDGPMMIIAGAGSGKTRVLTLRIAYLIGNGVEPFNILALTFTNKAAREMRERIEKLVGPEAKNLWMGTFHSVFARILRYEAEKIGYQSGFSIYDTDDSKSLIKTILKEYGLDDKLYKPSTVLNRISQAKNNLISWKAYIANQQLLWEDKEAGRPRIGEIYREYATRCFKANAMDFDDLLFNTNILFQNHLDVLNKYQHRFRYVMIDEFQDTNVSQYLITRRLSSMHQNICVVGDDAQSIYAFRGANIQNILNFEKDYPDLRVIKLEQNYRSTRNIVDAANSIIRHNREQLKKSVWTDNQEGALVQLIKCTSDSEEGRLIATSIFEEKMTGGLSYKDFAILYRTNAQSRAIEEALRRMNIRYKIIGGLSFYQRKEVKDLLAYLRFVVNGNDEEAFKRIVNLPKRGIGGTTVEKIILKANELQLPIWETLLQAGQHFTVKITATLDPFTTLIQSLKLTATKKDAYEVARQAARESGLLKELFDDKSLEGKVRYENVQELLNAMKAFVDDPDNEEKSLESFLQQVSLLTSSEEDNKEDAVTLMTIHMSKGLEFHHVYIAGLEENLFPSQMMLESRSDLEEERRLFYVAITRARKKLYLSYALQRYRFGKLIMSEPSRFIDEMDQRYLNAASTFQPPMVQSILKGGPAQSRKPATPPPPVPGKVHEASANFKPCHPSELKEGHRVEHAKFGFGRVLMVETAGNDRRARILFEYHGEKTLILSFARLMIHPS